MIVLSLRDQVEASGRPGPQSVYARRRMAVRDAATSNAVNSGTRLVHPPGRHQNGQILRGFPGRDSGPAVASWAGAASNAQHGDR